MKYQNARNDRPSAPRRFRSIADRPMAMLRHCPVYRPTPLREMPGLAGGSGTVVVKDETQRMRLGSFKALGGVFAVAQIVQDAAGGADLASETARAAAGGMTFITASAGNHGLSVAAGARIFGARGVIVLGSAVPEAFAARIHGMGAEVVRVDGSYEDSIAHAVDAADRQGWLLLADGSWEGCTERPALVMEGYTVLAEECRSAFSASGDWPTHVFLQAGVGGLAGAISAHIREHWTVQPHITIVEPEAAPCLLKSIEASALTRADGGWSNMGRLDCKDASLIAFEALQRDADCFVTVTDAEAEAAVQDYAEHRLFTTPSGAATLAAFRAVNLGAHARCLLIATEGPEAA